MNAARSGVGSIMPITPDLSTATSSANSRRREDTRVLSMPIRMGKVHTAASTWRAIRGTGPVPRSPRPTERNAAGLSMRSAADRGMPTRIPAGPTSAGKDAAHRGVTIRSDSGWWSNPWTRPDAPLIRFLNPEPRPKVIRILYRGLESRPDVIQTRFRNPESPLGGPQIQLTDAPPEQRSPVIEF